MSNASIRPAEPSDARSLAEVHVSSWRSTYRDVISPEVLARLSVDDRERAWRGRLQARAGEVIFVADEGDRVVGLAYAGPSEDDDDDPSEVATLFSLYLLQREQGRGIGKRLMEATLADLREAGYREATLWVVEQNPVARRFYERTGWRSDAASKECFGSIDVRVEVPTIRYRRGL